VQDQGDNGAHSKMINRALFLFMLVLFTGCSEQVRQSDYKSEANALCDDFNPGTWGVDFDKMNPVQKAKMLQKKSRRLFNLTRWKKLYKH